jgi:hypothetical protein
MKVHRFEKKYKYRKERFAEERPVCLTNEAVTKQPVLEQAQTIDTMAKYTYHTRYDL